jgi:hypothetical protein
MYYAVIRHEGKLHRRILETTARATANRKREDERRKICRQFPQIPVNAPP